MNARPIFILGAHKSGTTLLRNLLSGHQDLFVVPFESHYFQLSDHDVNYEYRKNRKKGLTTEQIEDNFKQWIRTQNEAVDPMGDTFVTGKLDTDKFNDVFRLTDPDTERVRFEKYMDAIHQSLGLGPLPTSKRVVEKSVENAEFAVELSKMYPQARFIHIVRNPYANFVSLRKYKSIGFGYPYLKRMVRTFQNSYYYLKENPKHIEHYKTVRYEDLLNDTEKTMREIADFLNIKYESSMLRPSVLGDEWKGNSTSGQQFKGISTANLDTWKKDIYPLEVCCVNSLAQNVFKDHGYEMIEPPRLSLLDRMNGENFFRFIVNRCWYIGCRFPFLKDH